jgi:uncharacterized protein
MKVPLRRTSEDFVEKQTLQDSPQALELEAEGVTFEDPVRVELTLAKSQDQLICKGRVKASVKLECSRCLAEYPAELGSDLAFVVDLDCAAGKETSAEGGYFVAEPTATDFDIDQLVREAVLLSLPFKPLCSERCRGLCPICGADLNRSPCGCVRKSVDHRWDKLKGLLENKA